MDLSKFKKISHVKGVTTLRHEDGHEMKLSHDKLPGDVMSELESMPFHKYAEGSEEPVSQDDGSYGPKQKTTVEKVKLPDEPAIDMQSSSAEIPQENLTPPQDASLTPSEPAPLSPPVTSIDETPPTTESVYKGNLEALNQQMKGQQTIAKSQADYGKDIQNIQANERQQQAISHGESIRKLAPLEAKDAELNKWLESNPANAGRYIDKMSTGGKISTALGLLFGGIGAGLTHGPNLAAKYLDDQIERDLQSQKEQIATKKGLLAHNLQETRNIKEAEQLTRIQNKDIMASYLSAAAGKAQNTAAQGTIMSLAGQFKMQAQQLKQQYVNAKLAQGDNMGSGDPARLAVQMIKEPADRKAALEEIKNAENVSRNGPKIMEAFKNAADGVSVVDFVPGMENKDQKSLHQLLLPNFKTIDGTVRQAAMDETFKNVTPQFGDSPKTKEIKMQALKDWMHSESAAPTARGHGIDLSKFKITSENMESPVERIYQGKIALFDPQTKKFLRYK